MDYSGFLDGLLASLTLTNLLFGILGTILGTLVGVLPGIGPALAISLLLPVTFQVEPTSALIMFCAIYYGTMYGGSTTSILLNAPGESGSVMTTIEGNKMAKAGRAGAALATAAIGSFVAGAIATSLLALGAPAIAELG
ncbi:MAG: tripartite tricarboxylate transporter permease, partial [Actinobacteria bacterium]|nr:tripartite tricarboxylate transporter permease [Actinomycetota bacterium]